VCERVAAVTVVAMESLFGVRILAVRAFGGSFHHVGMFVRLSAASVYWRLRDERAIWLVGLSPAAVTEDSDGVEEQRIKARRKSRRPQTRQTARYHKEYFSLSTHSSSPYEYNALTR
jgi:hypothetical protein